MQKGRPKKHITFWDRLESYSYVNENGCVIFTGYTDRGGYGWIMKEGKQVLIHREVFRKYNPNIEMTGVIMHLCDTPNCINPDHLRHGTQAENVSDMIAKGRKASTKGSMNSSAKIVESDVVKIRELAGFGVKNTVIAKRFGIGASAVGRIVNGKTWKHVKEESL